MWSYSFFYAVAVAVLLGQCVPRTKIWIFDLPGRCINIGVACILFAITNVLTDLITLASPVLVLWQLQMPLRRKAGVSIVFVMGFLYVRPSKTLWLSSLSFSPSYHHYFALTYITCSALASSIARAVYYIKRYTAEDQSYWMGPVSCWAYVDLWFSLL